MMSQEEKDQKQIDTLKEKGFKNFYFQIGVDKKLHSDGKLVPFNCKNLTGSNNKTYFSQTKEDEKFAAKLIVREINKDIKLKRGEIKELKAGKDLIKKTYLSK